MTSYGVYEPDKFWSACQAALLLFACVLPLAWNFDFDRTITTAPLSVAIVAPPPPPTQPQQPQQESLREIEESLTRQREAEIARRRAEQEEIERRRKEEEKSRQEAERKRKEEEQRKKEELAKEQEQKQEQERQRKLEEDRKRKEEEQRAREAELEAARKAKIEAIANAKLMDRFILGIHNQVQRHLANPEGVPTGIKVEIRIRLNAQGNLLTPPETISGSGHPQFDEQAIRAILRSAEAGFALPDDPDLRSEFEELILIISPRQ